MTDEIELPAKLLTSHPKLPYYLFLNFAFKKRGHMDEQGYSHGESA